MHVFVQVYMPMHLYVCVYIHTYFLTLHTKRVKKQRPYQSNISSKSNPKVWPIIILFQLKEREKGGTLGRYVELNTENKIPEPNLSAQMLTISIGLRVERYKCSSLITHRLDSL